MDGNGRWAESQGKTRVEGHQAGVTSVRRTVEECARLKIKQLTLFCFSTENWQRPQLEVQFLMQLLKDYLLNERDTMMKNNVRLGIIGRRKPLPADVLEIMDATVAHTSANTGLKLNLAINYGGRAEIVDAVKQIAWAVVRHDINPPDITEATVRQYLYDPMDVDLLIRPGRESRISNFLLWQCSYAEMVITNEYWPDFTTDVLHRALAEFATRQRRYGRVQ